MRESAFSPKIILIGAGNVAWHLGHRLREVGIDVVQVVNRSAEHGRALAGSLGADWTVDSSSISRKGELYILAIRDDAIASLAQELKNFLPENALVVHTSGGTPGAVLSASFRRHGVLYPLQSFSREQQVVWEDIPVCIDASTEADLQFLEKVARNLSPKVFKVTDDARAIVHVAAVFANNFPNFLFSVSELILENERLPFDLLRPLILETARKVQTRSPASMQTGPAVRGDDATIARHQQYLERYPELAELYRTLTLSIKSRHQK
jgi:predicted short-subunit dehydrogenase-like oxidoreductase (DUF2520 family)